jgi:hypothetical protein
VLFEGCGLGRFQPTEQIRAEELVQLGPVHRCTPISSRIVRRALTA